MLGGCKSSPNLPIGKDVIVQFDRRALGAGAPLPVSPTTMGINGAETAIRGKLIAVSHSWIEIRVSTVQTGGTSIKSYWIPKEKILLIQTDTFQAQ